MKNLTLTTASIIALSVAAASATTLTDLDTNGDGSADIGEVRAVAPTITQEEFNSIDTDGSNGWDDNEFGHAADMLIKHLPDSSGSMVKMDLASVDTNGDGSADIGEVQAVAPTVTQEQFNMIDADGSNGWDENEMNNAAAMLLAEGQMDESSTVNMAALDSNGNGSLDISEVQAASPTITQDEFNSIDTDGSNGWTENEINAAAVMMLNRK